MSSKRNFTGSQASSRDTWHTAATHQSAASQSSASVSSQDEGHSAPKRARLADSNTQSSNSSWHTAAQAGPSQPSQPISHGPFTPPVHNVLAPSHGMHRLAFSQPRPLPIVFPSPAKRRKCEEGRFAESQPLPTGTPLSHSTLFQVPRTPVKQPSIIRVIRTPKAQHSPHFLPESVLFHKQTVAELHNQAHPPLIGSRHSVVGLCKQVLTHLQVVMKFCRICSGATCNGAAHVHP